MINLGPLTVLNPWVLLALASLPVIWWLVRMTPPAPQNINFPAIRFLAQLRSRERSPAHTPLWLLVLRILMAALLILALSHPLYKSRSMLNGVAPLLLIMDNGWDSAPDWSQRQHLASAILEEAERLERPVQMIFTADPLASAITTLQPAHQALIQLRTHRVQSWPSSLAPVQKALADETLPKRAEVVWLHSGLGEPKEAEILLPLTTQLQRLGSLTLYHPGPTASTLLLQRPGMVNNRLQARLLRSNTAGPATEVLRAQDQTGRVLARTLLQFAPGENQAQAFVELPTGLRSQVTSLRLEGQNGAGSVLLMDDLWRRHPVGIIGVTEDRETQPLLSETHYLRQALIPTNEILLGEINTLVERSPSAIILPDMVNPSAVAVETLRGWVEDGGVVIRFAGPNLAAKPDTLLPGSLRQGNRTLGGALSWSRPAKLAPFPEGSPLFGTPVPTDVVVYQQVLAEPNLNPDMQTWATLEDGTPLITTRSLGQGRIILVHTSADPSWSTLAYSGLHGALLHKLVSLGRGSPNKANLNASALPPLRVLNGDGVLVDPDAQVKALKPQQPFSLGPTTPPGYYGNSNSPTAVNIADGVSSLSPLNTATFAPGTVFAPLSFDAGLDLAPWLLTAVLLLFLLDYALSLKLRGHIFLPEALKLRLGKTPTTLVLAGVLTVASLIAAPSPSRAQGNDDAFYLEVLSQSRLAYVKTGERDLDSLSRQGLRGLSRTLTNRTAIEPAEPIGVDPERDELSFYPILYWPISPNQAELSEEAIHRLNQYTGNGGMILFDTRDAPDRRLLFGAAMTPEGERLKEILKKLAIGPLDRLGGSHVLTRTFYLMNTFPGRYEGPPVWVEQRGENNNDGVASIIVGANDWAGAWAIDLSGNPLLPIPDGGDFHRELALRFGVNVIMYAMTGSYKADQVHLPAIMERLGN